MASDTIMSTASSSSQSDLSIDATQLNNTEPSSLPQRTSRRGTKDPIDVVSLVDAHELKQAKVSAANIQKKLDASNKKKSEWKQKHDALLKEYQSLKSQLHPSQSSQSDTSTSRQQGGDSSNDQQQQSEDEEQFDDKVDDLLSQARNCTSRSNSAQSPSPSPSRSHNASNSNRDRDRSRSHRSTRHRSRSRRRGRSRERRYESDYESDYSSGNEYGDSYTDSYSDIDDDRRDRSRRSRSGRRSRSPRLSLAQQTKRKVRDMEYVDIVKFSDDMHKYKKASDIPSITRMQQFIDSLFNMLTMYTEQHTDRDVLNMVSGYVKAMKRIADRHKHDSNVVHMTSLDRLIRQDLNGHRRYSANWRIDSDNDDIVHILNQIKDPITHAASSNNSTHHNSSTVRQSKQRARNSNSGGAPSSSNGGGSTSVCYKYNGESNGKNNFTATINCTRTNCKYKHVCIVCKGDHSRCEAAACRDADITSFHRA
jgi:hypothetical protein